MPKYFAFRVNHFSEIIPVFFLQNSAAKTDQISSALTAPVIVIVFNSWKHSEQTKDKSLMNI